ncbi:hypothetical protein NZL82_01665 [Sphingomonas sanguinis]|uniref:hypothetical protein n=1 Tax=Sphingomonas sp. LC-1 TaxID=3110957 RepID=UPI0021BAAC5E|nr:hypothetical protein [Sphingomonas sp. LC-1]MCT8000579.1 hypothetical protein [Sphingomonas sp. LC-1]
MNLFGEEVPLPYEWETGYRLHRSGFGSWNEVAREDVRFCRLVWNVDREMGEGSTSCLRPAFVYGEAFYAVGERALLSVDHLFRDECVDTLAAALRHPDLESEWAHQALPGVLASGAIDAMTKLRLAARWAEDDMTYGG